MDCACGRPLPPKAPRCMYCGADRPAAEPGDDEEKQLACPGCGAAMAKRQRHAITIDDCDGCGGTWYDLGELEQALERAVGAEPDPEGAAAPPPTAERAPEPVRYRQCPHCDAQMQRRRFTGTKVVLDHCAAHGVYLDAGELDAILHDQRIDPTEGEEVVDAALAQLRAQLVLERITDEGRRHRAENALEKAARGLGGLPNLLNLLDG